MPFSLIYAVYFVLLRLRYQNNALTVGSVKKLSGKKKGVVGEAFSVEILKKAAKKHGATINDFIMAMLSVSLNKYYQAKG